MTYEVVKLDVDRHRARENGSRLLSLCPFVVAVPWGRKGVLGVCFGGEGIYPSIMLGNRQYILLTY